ncbi:MAG TPA: hypothetical protein DCY13_05125 [Verrucomicrobiales bacterium]|nr:hypothetical protein [Verrucomicrobiales bacterium]
MRYPSKNELKMISRAGSALAVAWMALGQAQAGLITRTFDFTATAWFITPPVPPVATLVGSATVTFDTDDDSLATYTTGITLNSLNVALGSDVGFIYDPTGSLPGTGVETLFVGGIEGQVFGTFNTDDFAISIENPSSVMPMFSVALLSTPSATWRSEIGTVTATATAVPEPLTLALFGIGMVGLVVTRRRAVSSSNPGVAPSV